MHIPFPYTVPLLLYKKARRPSRQKPSHCRQAEAVPLKIKGRFLNIIRFHRLSFLFLILLVQKRLYECFSHQGILLFFSVLFHSLHHFDRLMIQNRFPKNFLH